MTDSGGPTAVRWTAGQSSLSYDATTDHYTYVWKTDRNWTGCRTLSVKLADGSALQANFKFSKQGRCSTALWEREEAFGGPFSVRLSGEEMHRRGGRYVNEGAR